MNRRTRVIRTRGGARLVQADATLSRVVDRPGPTHGLFDVLAATVVAAAPGPRFLMLGFAAGGMVAPLRGLGWREPIEALDRSPLGTGLFRELCGGWAGEVHVRRGDAVEYLRRTRRRWDVILDDLSVLGPDGVRKPEVSYDVLPQLIRSRLRPGGLAVVNVLERPGANWTDSIDRLRAADPASRIVHTRPYENRVLISGRDLPSARTLSATLRRLLATIGSGLAGETHLRSLPARGERA